MSREAEIWLNVEKFDSNLNLIAVIHPFLAVGKIDRQRIRISLNNSSIGEWNLSQNAYEQYEISLPKKYIDDKLIRIMFEIPDAASPKELGVGNDFRQLGVCFKSLKIIQTP